MNARIANKIYKYSIISAIARINYVYMERRYTDAQFMKAYYMVGRYWGSNDLAMKAEKIISKKKRLISKYITKYIKE